MQRARSVALSASSIAAPSHEERIIAIKMMSRLQHSSDQIGRPPRVLRCHSSRFEGFPAGQQRAFRQRRVDHRGHVPIRRRSRRCLHMGNQPRQILIARLGQMDFVAHPLGCVLLCIVGIAVIRGTDERARGRDIVGDAPPHAIENPDRMR